MARLASLGYGPELSWSIWNRSGRGHLQDAQWSETLPIAAKPSPTCRGSAPPTTT